MALHEVECACAVDVHVHVHVECAVVFVVAPLASHNSVQ